MIEKIIKILKMLAERKGEPIGVGSNRTALKLLVTDRKSVLKDLQLELLDYSLVVVGRKFCTACEKIKQDLKPGDLYVDADLVTEILPELIGKNEAIFPLIFQNGEFVLDGIDLSNIEFIAKEKKDV